ncbi:hypothetical protein [Haloarchaeobius iranensis]|uniref:Uncharacterized protein n=1 Tax=Haloarchaeobius iranensis TaxID=996166 RepID=A0A1G9X2B6_9EURY|nr:hypothetical protein [Haloarchaeobius iranensis]SDM90812.1 hypothetical protein SAMN05192554_109112 [Haloarchaeobius iranensis]
MQRRGLLTAFATAVAGVAGCVQGPLDATGGRSPDPQSGSWEAPPPCPTFDARADRTVCTGAGQSAPPAAPVTLKLPAKTPIAPDTQLGVSLHPRGDEPVTFDPAAWGLHRYADGEWRAVASGRSSGRYATVYPDERHDWVFDGSGTTAGNRTAVRHSLAPGRYAFAVTVSAGRGWTFGDRFECVALFAMREP